MKEIIPIKKDIIFKTKIGEITNINLDLDYKINNDLIDGNVLLNGTYKMTEASLLEDEFDYKIPFGVSISKKVDKNSIKIEIDDFKYNISKDVMNANIDLELTCNEESEKEETKEENEINNIIEESNNEEINDLLENDTYLENNFLEDNTTINEEVNNINIEENVNNITNNFINNDNKYYTYKVYIVREGDTIESICNKYNINVEDIKDYNDLSEINVGDKIIIPYLND